MLNNSTQIRNMTRQSQQFPAFTTEYTEFEYQLIYNRDRQGEMDKKTVNCR